VSFIIGELIDMRLRSLSSEHPVAKPKTAVNSELDGVERIDETRDRTTRCSRPSPVIGSAART
jgi:hypothetical protein